MQTEDKAWTRFVDMNSGGGQKEKFSELYIQASEQEARIVFYNRFGHNPDRITCTCCGKDYSVSEEKDLIQATAYHRGCRFGYIRNGREVSKTEGWKYSVGLIDGAEEHYFEEADPDNTYRKYLTLVEYLKREDVQVIYAEDIKSEERLGEIPEQDYIWR